MAQNFDPIKHRGAPMQIHDGRALHYVGGGLLGGELHHGRQAR